MAGPEQPWNPADATTLINEIARDPNCKLSYTRHARERIGERGLIVSDVLFVLRNGYVYQDPEPSTVEGFFKYVVESQSPNSGARYLKVVAIPDRTGPQIKIVTAMWRD